MEKPEPEYEDNYSKGFNEGYVIAKHAPELSSKLSEIKGHYPRLEGLLDGIEQYALEMKRERENDPSAKWYDDKNDTYEPDKDFDR